MDTPKLDLIGSFDELMKIDDRTYETVATPEWGPNSGVMIRSLSAGEAIAWTEANEAAKNSAGLRLIILSVVRPDTKSPLFTEGNKQMDALKGKSNHPLKRIVTAVLKLNGFGKEEAEAAKNDSGETPTGDSPSDSASSSAS